MSKQSEVWDLAAPFVFNTHVDSSALDSYLHVNNSVYVKWMDDCARAHSLAVGIDCEQAATFGWGMAVREAHIKYLAAAHQGDEIEVAAWVIKNDQKLRISRQFQIRRVADKTTLVRATLDYVCINIATGKPAKMPAEFCEHYRVLCGYSPNTKLSEC